MISYLRTSESIIGGPGAMLDFISSHTTSDNLEKITRGLDMNVRDAALRLNFLTKRVDRI